MSDATALSHGFFIVLASSRNCERLKEVETNETSTGNDCVSISYVWCNMVTTLHNGQDKSGGAAFRHRPVMAGRRIGKADCDFGAPHTTKRSTAVKAALEGA